MAVVERLTAYTKSKTNSNVKMSRESTKREHVRSYDDSAIRDRYEFTQKLGQGAFGVVHLAIRRCDATPWAIKAICKPTDGAVDVLKRIEREVQILKTTSHPFIISMFGVYESRETFYLILEYCDLGTLESWMNGSGSNGAKRVELTETEIRAIVWQIVLALAHLHRNCVIHRDLKPSNILCTSVKPNVTLDSQTTSLLEDTPFYIKLTDFSVSVVKEPDELLNEVCGTLNYMAPEVVDETKLYSRQCDVWSLGVILYELLATHLPFRGPDSATIRSQIRRAEYDISASKFKRFSHSTISCLKAMLEADPARRITAKELLHHSWFRQRKSSNEVQSGPSRKDSKARDRRPSTLPNVIDLMRAFKQELDAESHPDATPDQENETESDRDSRNRDGSCHDDSEDDEADRDRERTKQREREKRHGNDKGNRRRNEDSDERDKDSRSDGSAGSTNRTRSKHNSNSSNPTTSSSSSTGTQSRLHNSRTRLGGSTASITLPNSRQKKVA